MARAWGPGPRDPAVPERWEYPRCPVWCTAGAEHDDPGRPPRPRELLRRHHVGELVPGDAAQAAEVRLERVDDVFPGGPVLTGPAVIVLDSVEGPMSVPEFRALAAELGRVVGELAELDLDDPHGHMEGWSLR